MLLYMQDWIGLGFDGPLLIIIGALIPRRMKIRTSEALILTLSAKFTSLKEEELNPAKTEA